VGSAIAFLPPAGIIPLIRIFLEQGPASPFFGELATQRTQGKSAFQFPSNLSRIGLDKVALLN
jgi:hypothetical protein